jgi:hypothetical protein
VLPIACAIRSWSRCRQLDIQYFFALF